MAGIANATDSTAATTGRQPPASRTPSWRANFAIRPARVRTLLWLRWRLTVRGYTRSWQRIVGLVLALLFIVPLAFAVAIGTSLAYTATDRATATQILFGVMVLVYGIWALLPLLQYTLNEGLDITKLQAYPLTRGEQMVSLLLASLLDVGTLVLVALYVGVVSGWHATPLATLVTLVAVSAAYVHTIGLSQLLLAALMGVLRSRRYRDLSIILFALAGSGCSIANQLLLRGLDINGLHALPVLHLDTYLRWTPPGMAAEAIVLANAGHYLQALPWLAGTLLLAPLLLMAWAQVLDRSITNAEVSGAAPRRRRRQSPAVTALDGPTGASAGAATKAQRRQPISRVARAIAVKDARYLWRDPQLKAAFLSALLAMVFVLVPGLYGDPRRSALDDGTPFGGYSVLLGILPALIIVLTFGLNALGLDRQGLQMLFLFPVRPLDILFGKNLLTGALSAVVLVVLTMVKATMIGDWSAEPVALTVGVAAILVMLGCGNVTSVLVPFRWRQMRTGDTSTLASENNVLRALLSIVTLLLTALLLIPVALAVIVPLGIGRSGWLLFSLPLALLYGAGFHQLASRAIAPVMLRRASDILAVTARDG